MAKLKDMAFGQDDEGCWNEASCRVRAAAKNALNACELIVGPTEAPPEQIRERPVEQTSTAPRTFDPSIEAELRMALSALLPDSENVKPAGYSWTGKSKAHPWTNVLRQPNSTEEVDPQARFRGAVVRSSK